MFSLGLNIGSLLINLPISGVIPPSTKIIILGGGVEEFAGEVFFGAGLVHGKEIIPVRKIISKGIHLPAVEVFRGAFLDSNHIPYPIIVIIIGTRRTGSSWVCTISITKISVPVTSHYLPYLPRRMNKQVHWSPIIIAVICAVQITVTVSIIQFINPQKIQTIILITQPGFYCQGYDNYFL